MPVFSQRFFDVYLFPKGKIMFLGEAYKQITVNNEDNDVIVNLITIDSDDFSYKNPRCCTSLLIKSDFKGVINIIFRDEENDKSCTTLHDFKNVPHDDIEIEVLSDGGLFQPEWF